MQSCAWKETVNNDFPSTKLSKSYGWLGLGLYKTLSQIRENTCLGLDSRFFHMELIPESIALNLTLYESEAKTYVSTSHAPFPEVARAAKDTFVARRKNSPEIYLLWRLRAWAPSLPMRGGARDDRLEAAQGCLR